MIGYILKCYITKIEGMNSDLHAENNLIYNSQKFGIMITYSDLENYINVDNILKESFPDH